MFWSVCALLVQTLGIFSQYLWSSLGILMILKRQLKKWSDSRFPRVDFPCCGLLLSDSIRVLAPSSNGLESCSTLLPVGTFPLNTFFSMLRFFLSFAYPPPNNKTIPKSYHSLKFPENYWKDLHCFTIQNKSIPISLYLTHQRNLEPSLSQLKSESSWGKNDLSPPYMNSAFSKCRSSWSK